MRNVPWTAVAFETTYEILATFGTFRIVVALIVIDAETAGFIHLETSGTDASEASEYVHASTGSWAQVS